MTYQLLPEKGLVRLSTILKIIPISKSTWRAGVKAGRFPKAVKLGSRITAWRAEDINNLISQLPAQCVSSSVASTHLKREKIQHINLQTEE